VLAAGDYTFGIYVTTVLEDQIPGQYTRTSNMAVAWQLGSAPNPPSLSASGSCPTNEHLGAPETGAYDQCSLLECAACKMTSGCGYCRIAYAQYDFRQCQTIDSTGLCQGPFSLLDVAPYNSSMQCPPCESYNCKTCLTNEATCSWCQQVVGNNLTIFGCVQGTSCPGEIFGHGITPATDPAVCTTPVSLINVTALATDVSNATSWLQMEGSGLFKGSGSAPPVNSNGQIIPPQSTDPCLNLVSQCQAKCGSSAVKVCSCLNGAPNIACVTSGTGGPSTKSAPPSSIENLLAGVVLAACAIIF